MGLYYYRFRYYRPEIGRFLQTDPLGYFAGLNLYTYVGNNPLNWLDPWGLCEKDIERDTFHRTDLDELEVLLGKRCCKDEELELEVLIDIYKDKMREFRGEDTLVKYRMCYKYRAETLKWGLDTEHYKLRGTEGRKTMWGFGPPRFLWPGEESPSQAFVAVYDESGNLALMLDPWTPPLGPLDYHAPSLSWVWRPPIKYEPDWIGSDAIYYKRR